MKRFEEMLHRGYAQSFEVKEIIFQEKTEHQDLVIFETSTFGRVMALDNVIQVTTRDEYAYHEMMTHVPIFAKGDATEVLIIGGGDGGILREVLRHQIIKHATMVEIDRTVVDLSKQYFPELSNGAFEDARTELVITDGVKFVAETDKRFDVIIVDSTDPMGPGEVLFTESFYASCHRCLKDGGVLVTQNGVPFFQGDEVINTYQRMGKSFQDNGFYTTVVPTYCGGFMTLGWGSDDASLRDVDVEILRARFEAADISMRYYTPDMHRAAFVLPQFILDIIP